MNLLDESDSSRLSFGSHDDALNFADHCVENIRNRITFNRFDCIESYAVGALEVVLKLRIRRDNREYDFVFGAIVDGRRNVYPAASRSMNFEIHVSGELKDRNQEPVLVDVVRPVQCPNQVIPSLVRLECAKERNYIGRNVLTSSLDHVVEFSYGVGDREISGLGIDAPGGNSGSVSSLIEGRPKVSDNFSSEVAEPVRDGAEFDLVDFVQTITIDLNRSGAGVRFKKLIGLPFEFVKLGLCARDAAL